MITKTDFLSMWSPILSGKRQILKLTIISDKDLVAILDILLHLATVSFYSVVIFIKCSEDNSKS